MIKPGSPLSVMRILLLGGLRIRGGSRLFKSNIEMNKNLQCI
jgi:hypothetical protein